LKFTDATDVENVETVDVRGDVGNDGIDWV